MSQRLTSYLQQSNPPFFFFIPCLEQHRGGSVSVCVSRPECTWAWRRPPWSRVGKNTGFKKKPAQRVFSFFFVYFFVFFWFIFLFFFWFFLYILPRRESFKGFFSFKKKLRIKKTIKPKNPFLVGIFRWVFLGGSFWVGFFGWVFLPTLPWVRPAAGWSPGAGRSCSCPCCPQWRPQAPGPHPPAPYHQSYMCHCCGSVCFWASRIRIRIH
jgi:hypothetical protein